MTEDARLLRQYADRRDEGAFAELVRRHLDLVYSAAMRRTGGDTHQAQDIVQFVFNELALKASAVARHPTLSGWLHVATRNAALNAARAERRRRFYEQQSSAMNESTTPAPGADWDRIRPVLDDVIDNLGQADRDAVVLRFLGELPFADIGRALRVSEDAARMRTERALEKLRRSLAQRGVTSTSTALAVLLTGNTTMAAPAGMAATVAGTALTSSLSAGGVAGVAAFWAVVTGSKFALGTAGVIILAAIGLGTAYREHPAPALGSSPVQPSSALNAPAPVPATAAIPAAATSAPPTALPAVARTSSNPAASPSVEKDPNRAETLLLRRNLGRDYGPLADKLGLTPGQREQFITLLVDERKVAVDYAAAGGASGVDVTIDFESFDVTVRALREKLYGEIEALLGPDGYGEYRQTRAALQRQSWAPTLEKRLRRTPEPLSAQQRRQFESLLNERDLDPKSDAMLDAAGRFLSPAQLTALRELQNRRIAGSQKQEVQDAVRESTARTPSKP